MKMIFGAFILILTACASSPKVYSGDDLEKPTEVASGVLIPFSFQDRYGYVSSSGCILSIQNKETSEKSEVYIRTGMQNYLVNLAAGEYHFSAFYCGSRANWDLKDEKDVVYPFKVLLGKISLMSPIDFELTSRPALSDDYMRKSAAVVTLQMLWTTLPEATKSKMISAYSLKTVTEASLGDRGDIIKQDRTSF